jgi:uroporphyrin-III C-methyltransferase
MNKPGKVFIVGAGPGDPGLITVKGLACLRQADVLLYDRLVHPLLLDEAPAWAELIDVGKAPARHRRSQAEINKLLVEHAQAGRLVVRLKGGDPFVFGRGGEECQALSQAGVDYEVVPGVSSALAVPAYAGIPVTHRSFASSFTVVTGHSSNPETGGVNWADLPRSGTLVCLMGVSHLPEIARQLMAHGRPPETPAAVIGCGTTAGQTTVEAPLADIAERASHVPAPATVIVGEVVRLRQQLDWFKPATGEFETSKCGMTHGTAALFNHPGAWPPDIVVVKEDAQ